MIRKDASYWEKRALKLEYVLSVVRQMIKGKPIEHEIVTLDEPDVGLGQWLERHTDIADSGAPSARGANIPPRALEIAQTVVDEWARFSFGPDPETDAETLLVLSKLLLAPNR